MKCTIKWTLLSISVPSRKSNTNRPGILNLFSLSILKFELTIQIITEETKSQSTLLAQSKFKSRKYIHSLFGYRFLDNYLQVLVLIWFGKFKFPRSHLHLV